MGEFVAISAGVLLGGSAFLRVGLLASRPTRGVFAVVAGATATLSSGEYQVGWIFFLVDIAVVATTAWAVYALLASAKNRLGATGTGRVRKRLAGAAVDDRVSRSRF